MVLSGKFIFISSKIKRGIKDPEKTYYYLNLFDGEDCSQIPCTKDVYEQSLACEPMTMLELGFIYNSQYNTLRCTDLFLS